ncbi:glutathione S-transferase N-terminal domain-containing protein [Gammaproteobacteria bacterium]|nr:glutathione S-transferase N-terminal domain-containing protein [Gammaproteobacteria bacterium]
MTINNPHFVSGDRNYSSSSLRVWLLLNEFEVSYHETVIKLFQSDSVEKIAMHSPSLQLPVFIHDSIKVWDSLAICEYINETFLEGRAWPQDAKKRAAARSIANEIHADFKHFKKDWPMNCQLKSQVKVSTAIEKEIARLDAIIYCCRTNFGDGGNYLFGQFSIVDCMLAPIVIALDAYGADLSQLSKAYIQTLLSNQYIECWLEQAESEITKELHDIDWEQTA